MNNSPNFNNGEGRRGRMIFFIALAVIMVLVTMQGAMAVNITEWLYDFNDDWTATHGNQTLSVYNTPNRSSNYPTYGDAVTTGTNGSANFTAITDDGVYINNKDSYNTSGFTLSAWIRWKAIGGGIGGLTAISKMSSQYGPVMKQYDADGDMACGFSVSKAQSAVCENCIIQDTWQHWTCVYLGGGVIRLYLDGKSKANITTTQYNNDVDKWIIGREALSNTGRELNGQVDHARLVNFPLTWQMVENEYQCGNYTTCGSTPVKTETRVKWNFTAMVYEDGYHTNDMTPEFTLNLSAKANLTLWYSAGGADPYHEMENATDIEYFPGLGILFPNQTAMNVSMNNSARFFKVEAEAWNATNSNTTTSFNVTFDDTFVVLSMVDGDVSAANTTTINYHTQTGQTADWVVQAIDTYMHSYNQTVIGNVTGKIYSNQTVGIANNTFSPNVSINFSTYPAQRFYIHINASDDHTKDKIENYTVDSSKKSAITFKPGNNNNIKIETREESTITAEKLYDRYSFTMDFDDGFTKTREFDIKTDLCPLYYKDFTKYQGHFVSSCGVDGNWIDFEGVGELINVVKQDNYHYTITLANVPPVATFNSIGGLNIRNKNFANFLWSKTPNNPASLTSSDQGSTWVNLTWPAATGASFYEISNSTDDIINVTGLWTNISGLLPAGAYTFYVNSIYNDSGTYYPATGGPSANILMNSNTTVTFNFYNGTVQGFEWPETTNWRFSWITQQINESGAWSSVETGPSSAVSTATNLLCDGNSICKVTLTFNDWINANGTDTLGQPGKQIYEWYHTYQSFGIKLWVMEDMNSALSFAVLNDLGTPITNARVQLYQDGGQEITVGSVNRTAKILVGQRYTDDSGIATFYVNTSRIYAYDISKAGYSVAQDEIHADEYVNNTLAPIEIRLSKDFVLGDANRIIYMPTGFWNTTSQIDFWIRDEYTNTSFFFNTSFENVTYKLYRAENGYWTGLLTAGTQFTTANFTLNLRHGDNYINTYNFTFLNTEYISTTITGKTNPLEQLNNYADTWLTPLLIVLLIIISIGVGSYVNTETGNAGFTTFMIGLIIISMLNPTTNWYLAVIPGLYFLGTKLAGIIE